VVVAPIFEEEEEAGRGGMWEHDAVDFFAAFYHALYIVGKGLHSSFRAYTRLFSST